MGPRATRGLSAAGKCEVDGTLEGCPNEGKRGVGSDVLPTEERVKWQAKVELAEEDATIETGAVGWGLELIEQVLRKIGLFRVRGWW